MEEKAGSIGQNLDRDDARLPSAAPGLSPKGPREVLEPRLWRLSPEEKKALDQLVAQNSRRAARDGLESAFALLKLAKTKANQAPIFAFLAETARFALAWGELETVSATLKTLAELARIRPETLGSAMADFQVLLTREETLDGLLTLKPKGGDLSPGEQGRLNEFFACLPNQVEGVAPLFKLYPQIQDRGVKTEVLKAIAAKAPIVGADLAPVINASFQPRTVVRLIELIPLSNEDQSIPFVAGLSRSVAPAVREKAAQLLLEGRPDRIGLLGHLLADPDPTVSRLIFSLISQKRDPAVEKILLNFLRNSYEFNQPRSESALLNGYRCLGLCASSPRAAEFAGQVLLKKNFKALLGLGVDREHRQGAALALLLMPPGLGQESILSQAAHSLFRDLRRAYQAAETEQTRHFQ
jgi:hypothetical protein